MCITPLFVGRVEWVEETGENLTGKDGNGAACKTSAVVLDKRHLATYAHMDHKGLNKGDIVKVWDTSSGVETKAQPLDPNYHPQHTLGFCQRLDVWPAATNQVQASMK